MSRSFKCPSCGGPLDYEGGEALTVRCPFCSNSVIVPEELRKAQGPAAAATATAAATAPAPAAAVPAAPPAPAAAPLTNPDEIKAKIREERRAGREKRRALRHQLRAARHQK